MQSYPLTVDKFLDHAARWFADREVVDAQAGTVATRARYEDIRDRSNRMSGALQALGMRTGEPLATLAWNTLHHFELYYASMGAGLVCHTLNPRLTTAQLAAMIAEAGERVLAVSADLLPLARELMPLCPAIAHVVVIDQAGDQTPIEGTTACIWTYEQLLADKGHAVPWGEFPEDAPAGLCYTSGTTGAPKGVLYTHRSNYLHTLRALQADAMALTSQDVVLLAVPMFHANGWGLPFAAPAVGARLVLPGRQMDGASLARLMRDEGVTVALGVHTVWLSVVDRLEQTGETLPSLQRIIIGGSSCPQNLIRRMEEGLGARVQTSWGMTELSPLGTIAPSTGPAATSTSGRPVIGLDLKLTDAAGVRLPEQPGQLGHLRVKGASVIDRYFDADADVLDDEGYFDTGDLAVIDGEGNLSICGRSKDLIKSGGEWINPAEIEAIVGRNPAVGLVAVISTPHEKWGERPLLVVQPRGEAEIDSRTLVDAMRGKIADWWIPERIARVAAMPLSGSGKIDKLRLRQDYDAGRIVGEAVRR